jgi:chemotaxis protein CheX
MKAEHINPFVAAATNTFASLLSCELTRGPICLKADAQPAHDITGIIGLSGRAIGTVAVSFEREVAFGAVEALLGERHSEIDAQVVDTIGEITNIIAGSAKARLDQFEMSISIPSVIVGKNHCVQFPSNSSPIRVPFESIWGAVCLEVSLVELPADCQGTALAMAAAAHS